jgi:hypothetical protein
MATRIVINIPGVSPAEVSSVTVATSTGNKIFTAQGGGFASSDQSSTLHAEAAPTGFPGPQPGGGSGGN